MPRRRFSLPSLPAVLIATLLGLVGALALPLPASAHDELLGSDPAPGSTLEQAPDALTLTFSGLISPEEGATVIEATDGAGTLLTDGAPVVQDNTVTQPLVAADGPVTVLWKVVSSDGHPISGELSFTVAAPQTPTPEPETAAPVETSQPEPSASDEPSPTATPAPAADAGSIIPWIIVGVVLAAAGGVLVSLLLARAQGRRPGTGSGADR